MRPSVIIADDDPFITQLLSEICDSERMDVRIASDGEELIAMLLEARPDLILLDIMMPKMNGFQVLEELSCMPPMRNVAVIVISAVSDNASVRKGYQLGAQDYFIKPFRVGELLSRLRSHLKAAAYRNLPGDPLDHELGDESQLGLELKTLLERPRRGPLSLMSVSLMEGEGDGLPRHSLIELAKIMRMQIRLVDRLFLMPDGRMLFIMPSTSTNGMEALQERLGEQLLDQLQELKVADTLRPEWERSTVVPGAVPEGWVEKLLEVE
jgi:CheY-like chemotaxis protein